MSAISPPPLPSSRHKLFLQLARVAWMSLLIAFGANILIQNTSGHASPKASGIISAILVGLLALIGVVAGIFALFGIRRYGRKGLLWPAVTGVSLWVLLFALAALPAFLSKRSLAAAQKPPSLRPVTHTPFATRVEDE